METTLIIYALILNFLLFQYFYIGFIGVSCHLESMLITEKHRWQLENSIFESKQLNGSYTSIEASEWRSFQNSWELADKNRQKYDESTIKLCLTDSMGPVKLFL